MKKVLATNIKIGDWIETVDQYAPVIKIETVNNLVFLHTKKRYVPSMVVSFKDEFIVRR